jgi:hypothetical protein
MITIQAIGHPRWGRAVSGCVSRAGARGAGLVDHRAARQ